MVAGCFSKGKHPEVDSKWPRNTILETANLHLGRPNVRPCCQQRQKTSRRQSTWEERSLLKMRISSMQTEQKGSSPRTRSIICWKVFPAFWRPNSMHKNLNIPKGGYYRSLLDVFGGHFNLIIPLLEVKLQEHSRTRDPGGEVSYVGQRIPVRDSNIIQPLVFPTRPPAFLLITNHVERTGSRRCRTMHHACFLHG